jgi:mono/diheme cytochrome c family protein
MKTILLPAAWLLLLASATMTLVAAGRQAPSAPPVVATPRDSVQSSKAVVDRYCIGCHNARTRTAGLALDTMDLANVRAHAATWEKVARKLRTGAMPPAGLPRPDDATRVALADFVESSLDRAVAASPFPGAPSVHRLNRAEYANAIRDLLSLEVDTAALLPPDEPAYGFDNIGENLSISPALFERYSAAAAEITTLAVGDRSDVIAGSKVYRAPADLSQDRHNDGLPLGTMGGMLVRVTLPLDGEYVLKASLFKTNLGLIKGLEFERDVEFVVDGERVFDVSIGGEKDYEGMLQNQTAYADQVDARLQKRVALEAGPHDIGVTFRAKADVLTTRRLRPMLRTTSDTSETLLGPPLIQTMTVTGPFSPTGPGVTPSRRRIFLCTPASAAEEEGCARTILSALAHRAYRGTDTPADVQELLTFYRQGRADATFESGIAWALQRILAGPKFLVRMEREPNVAAGTIFRITDVELASRLSFFLWSSIPDEELLRVASLGRLRTPSVLEQQVRRMLADSKADGLVSNFAGQWLQLRNLRSQFPDSREFPDFDDQLRQAFRRETELLFNAIMREDRNVLDLMTADFTFVNERLAKHYGISNVYGDQFRRVPVTNPVRRGLLGQGSILTVTSHADRTSPVVRGKWIVENLLGSPAPLPPPNVPALPERKDLARPMSMRERMEAHRANPACASCHRMMDPLGFALENFDAVGAWRARDGRAAIDAAGVFIDGSPIDGPVALREAILKRPENFVSNLTEKLTIYGLGRGIDYRDMPTVRSIVRDAGQKNYRFSALVLGIVNSPAFSRRIKVTDAAPSVVAGR